MARGLLSRTADRLRDPSTSGLLGALLVYVVLGVANIIFLPRFYPPDEPRNAAYAFELWSGRLPRIPDPLPHAAMGTKKLPRADFHASAQHPPLYYALVGAPIKVAASAGDIVPGVKIARGITLAIGAAALVALFRMVRLLLPRLPAVAVATVGIFAAIPEVPNTFGIVYNDALGVLTALGLLHASFSILKLGPTRNRLVACAVWMALASLTRFAGVLMSCFGMFAVFLSAFVHDQGTFAVRARIGILRTLPLVAAVLVSSGWFYVRSLVLYGDITGAKVLFDILDRPYRGSPFAYFVKPRVWVELHDQLWRNLHGGTRFDDGSVTIARSFSVVGTACALIAAWRVRGWLRTEGRSRKNLAIAAAIVVVFLGTTLPPIAFHSQGGSLMVRYSLPVIWIPCMVAAIGFAAWSRPLLSQVALILLPAFALFTFELYAVDIQKGIVGTEFGIVIASEARGMPAAGLVFALTVTGVAAGIVLMVRSLGALHRRVDEAVEAVEPGLPVPVAEVLDAR